MTDTTEGKDQETGRFMPGNRFWEARSSHGRKPIFVSADELEKAVTEYFQWVEENPLHEERVFNGKDGIVRADVAKMRAMTIAGLCIFLDIDRTTWAEYAKRPDFSTVTTRAEEIIYSQKFAGAAADLLNANIIARDLGLKDTSESTVTLKDERTPEEIAAGIEGKLGSLAAAKKKGQVPQELVT